MAVEADAERWDQFSVLLSQRVDQYFAGQMLEKSGGATIVAKIAFGFGYFIITYIALLLSPPPVFYFAYLLHGSAHLFLMLNIGHDANHGALSSKRWINRFLSYTMDLCGISSRIWRITHHRFHHFTTNMYGLDEAVSGRSVFRFSPHAPYRTQHRFQHLYAPLTYFLVSLDWVFVKDFQFSFMDKPDGFPIRRPTAGELLELLLFKAFYIGYMIVVPVLAFGHSLSSVLAAFFISHCLIGIAALLLFQTAHVIEGSDFPSSNPDPKNHVRLTFGTTVDVAPRSKLLAFVAGGLNTHVAHHLYPKICHVHYRRLSEIIRASADECGIPYREYPNMFIPMGMHLVLLRRLATDH